jgi:hypothetical protein
MRIVEIENQGMIDQPLVESIDINNPTDTVRRILETSVDEFGPAMNFDDARAWLKTL